MTTEMTSQAAPIFWSMLALYVASLTAILATELRRRRARSYRMPLALEVLISWGEISRGILLDAAMTFGERIAGVTSETAKHVRENVSQLRRWAPYWPRLAR